LIRDEPVATETGEGQRDRLTGRADVVGELLMRPHDVDERPAAFARTPELSREVEEEAGYKPENLVALEELVGAKLGESHCTL